MRYPCGYNGGCIMCTKNIRALFILLALAALPLIFVACGSPAGVPSPPVEMPSPIVLKFVEPSAIHIDFSTISAATAGSVNVYDAVGSGGTYSQAIAEGPALLAETENGIATLLTGIGALEIPVSATTTTFEGVIPACNGTASCAAKLDFGDFDLDGVGGTEGCSGHTAALPVCARMWLDGTRFMAWVFDTYPAADNPGKSRFKVFQTSADGDEYVSAISFDHRDPLNKFTELFFRGIFVEAPNTYTSMRHIEAVQVGAADSALKRLNLRDEIFVNAAPDPMDFLYLGQFKEGENYWSGSVDDNKYGVFGEFTDVCAAISSGNAAADPTICDTLGIGVAGIDFTRAAVDADFIVPIEFPEVPTF